MGEQGSYAASGEAHLFTGHCPVQGPAVAPQCLNVRLCPQQPPGPLFPELSHPHRPGQPQSLSLWDTACFVRSALVWVPPLLPLPSPCVGVPSCCGPVRPILLPHFPQHQAPSLALGCWLHLPAHWERPVAWSWAHKHTTNPTLLRHTAARCREASGRRCPPGGQWVVSPGSGFFNSRWDRSRPQ